MNLYINNSGCYCCCFCFAFNIAQAKLRYHYMRCIHILKSVAQTKIYDRPPPSHFLLNRMYSFHFRRRLSRSVPPFHRFHSMNHTHTEIHFVCERNTHLKLVCIFAAVVWVFDKRLPSIRFQINDYFACIVNVWKLCLFFFSFCLCFVIHGNKSRS